MAAVKLNISLDAETARTLKQRASERHIPASRYLADLIMADAKREQDELADEGYRLLNDDTRMFAEAALQIAHEWLPPWDEEGPHS